MPKPRVTATDQLANVIEVVELGRRTGLLSVERGSGSVHEEGEIYFLHGRATYASLAGLRGREALAAMSRWGACRFSFDRNLPSPAPNIAAPPPGAPASNLISDPNLVHAQPGGGQRIPEGSGVWNYPQQAPGGAFPGGAFPSGASGPLYPSGPLGGSGPLDGGSGIFGTSGAFGSSGGLGAGAGAGGYGAFDGSGSFAGPGGYPQQQQQQRPFAPPPAERAQPSPSFLASRPRRAPDVRDLMQVVTSHNLSRGHRTILLLADGEHTVLDLARLSSKPVDEVTALLGDLEARGLVYYYR